MVMYHIIQVYLEVEKIVNLDDSIENATFFHYQPHVLQKLKNAKFFYQFSNYMYFLFQNKPVYSIDRGEGIGMRKET